MERLDGRSFSSSSRSEMDGFADTQTLEKRCVNITYGDDKSFQTVKDGVKKFLKAM